MTPPSPETALSDRDRAPGATPASLDALALTREDVLRDYRLACESRQASLVGRREVLTGKAKFGIFGDGKEVPQLAMARVFERGDHRAGYYRDQTFMLAIGELTLRELFAQLYAHADPAADPASAGRQMNAHFATRMLDPSGAFLPQAGRHNVPADLSPTASQMPKLVGLAYASRLYRELDTLRRGFERFSNGGREVAFGTIGNASCAEGMFWETVNAVGVLRSPMVLSIWDDGYGISVPNEHQVTKGDVGELLEGFSATDGGAGYRIYKVRGWDYPALVETYREAVEGARRDHVPAILHVYDLTQPQGHSTSGSHERYKSPERLRFEEEYCCNRKLREWLQAEGIASGEELDRIEREARERVAEERLAAWQEYRAPIDAELGTAAGLIEELASQAPAGSGLGEELAGIAASLARRQAPFRRDLMAAAADALVAAHPSAGDDLPARRKLVAWKREQELANRERYGSDLYSETAFSALEVPVVAPVYGEQSPAVKGFEVLNACFDAALGRYPNLVAFGEDVGRLGDVNQGMAGLQGKYGELRVADTGIRETTIVGQAIGLAMRGIRPIAEIQYLDYLLYCLQILSDDLATLRYRTRGGQKAPVIVRTRGHRLEGIWHSGSPMAGILNLVRGMYVCVPRDMTRAAGFYNTLLQGDDPALVVEVLNGYRAKEVLPDNVGELTVPLGVPEVIREGRDVTIVTYGACCKVALEAAELLDRVDVDAEVIDVQTLLPFDLEHRIVGSLEKTSRVVFVDEDVPGGATAYMLREVLEVQRGYRWLDSEPRTVPAAPHRPPYGSDGDYFSKPNRETVFEAVYGLMHEADPSAYPVFYR